LRGHLRLAGLGVAAKFLQDLTYVHELPNGINFRSAEFKGIPGRRARLILEGCAHSLENATITTYLTGTHYPSFTVASYGGTIG
jgi:hypothetical protein